MQKEQPPKTCFNSCSALHHVASPQGELECSADSTFSRRRFLQSTLVLSSFIALPACTRSSSTTPIELTRTFFSRDEYQFIAAAIARLIPGSKDDPGGIEAAVPYFIDRQLSGPYGRAERWYMEGPWADGTERQGYQINKTPGQLYRAAIAQINEYCQQHYGGKTFDDLKAGDQDDVLKGLEKGDITLPDVPAETFFSIFWQNTQEGFLSDPMYGGNRNFVGWKLIGFPGPRYNYVEEVTQYGKPYPHPPVGLLGRDGTQVRT